MNHILNGLIRPAKKRKPVSYLTTHYCNDCERLFPASKIGNPCIWCASKSTVPAHQWPPERIAEIRKQQEDRQKRMRQKAI